MAALCWLPFTATAQDQAADQSGERYCIWLFWTKDTALIKQALERLAQGDPFMVVARDTARQHPKTSQANADCMPAKGMDPAVLAMAKNLRIGEISRPFDLGGGTAMVMRTTDSHRRKAQELYAKGRFAQAERELLRDLKLHPASASALHMLALARTAQGDYKQAVGSLDKALSLSPNNPAMLNDKASALANLGRAGEAIPIFEKAMKLDPENPTIKSNLAWALTLAKKDPERAVTLAKEACKLAPGEARVWHTLAKVQSAQGRHAEAVVSLRQTLILAPKHAAASQDLVNNIKALSPKVLARLNQDCSPVPTESVAKPESRPEPKPKAGEETGLPKWLKPAPNLAGPGIALPSQWPSLPAAKPAVAPKEKAAQPDQGEKAAKAEVKEPAPSTPAPATPAPATPVPATPAPATPAPKIGKHIVSLPMPKFPEQTSQAAEDKPTEQTKDQDKPEPSADKAAEPETKAEAKADKPADDPADEPKGDATKSEPGDPAAQKEAGEKIQEPEAAVVEPDTKNIEGKPESEPEEAVATDAPKADQAESEPAKTEVALKEEKPKAEAEEPAKQAETAQISEDKKSEPVKSEAQPKPEPAQEAAAEPAGKADSIEPPAQPEPPVQLKPEKPEPEPSQEEADKAQPKEQEPAAQEAESEPAPKAPAMPDEPHYLIQVASYRPESLAHKDLKSWERRDISGLIEKWKDRRGRIWHRVLLGPFATQQEAEKKAKQLKAKRLVRDYYVVKRPAE